MAIPGCFESDQNVQSWAEVAAAPSEPGTIDTVGSTLHRPASIDPFTHRFNHLHGRISLDVVL